MRRLIYHNIAYHCYMAFAQQPVESTSNEVRPYAEIGKVLLGDQIRGQHVGPERKVEQLVINTKEVDCLTFVRIYTCQALGFLLLPITCKGYVTGRYHQWIPLPPALYFRLD